MNRAEKSEDQNPRSFCFACAWTIVASFLLIVPAVTGQAQQATSLADMARQARAQRPGQSASNASHAQQVADELSDDQGDSGAPGGFKTFNAGDYRLWVPAPYKVEGHDDAGIVLSGPMIGMKHPILLVGTPIIAHFGNNDDAFHDTATQFVHLYAQSANCSKATVDSHAAYQCSMAAGNLLGQVVGGNAVFVRASGYMYPVFCLAPTDSGSRDYINKENAIAKQWARESLEREEEDVKKVLQKCDTVFQSIHIKEGVAANKETADSNKPGASTPKAESVRAAVDPIQAPNGNIASQTQPAPTGFVSAPIPPAVAAESTIPAGFKVQAFNYCKSRTECWDASVLVPVDAQLVSSDCKQYVFELKVQGAPFLLLAGPGAASCDAQTAPDSRVRWNQLVDPESKRAPGSYSTIGSQITKVDGHPATIITLGLRKGLASWMGKRAEVESNGAQVVVGCMAPRETFPDGDAICSGLIGSLRLP